ncbi:hypothetical protein LRA02_08100 [Lentilactobacillus rapi]|uniref:Uncharacterized protein n=1 Tax=Lentilactobacillus rapi TaxID=481723 RepID=A0A512PL69_9LACO|nr:hypothetical protein LRA02_08100 [Lentilactobacillus rapi]
MNESRENEYAKMEPVDFLNNKDCEAKVSWQMRGIHKIQNHSMHVWGVSLRGIG